MSDSEFQKQMALLRRRMELLGLARRGAADVLRVKVKEHTVPEHQVRAHVRVLYRTPKPSAESRKLRVPKLRAA